MASAGWQSTNDRAIRLYSGREVINPDTIHQVQTADRMFIYRLTRADLAGGRYGGLRRPANGNENLGVRL